MDLNMEIGKKKAVYPSKKSLNLYYQEDVSSKVSTIILDVVFVAVVVIALLKVLLFDVIADKNNAVEKVEQIQKTLDQQMAAIEEYDDVAAEYARYSYKVLADEMNLVDRVEVLAMLEETVFTHGAISNVSITGDVISLEFDGLNLSECAQLIAQIQGYEIVKTVEISNQSGSADGTYSGNVTIMLVSQESENIEEAGGEQ